MTEHERDVQTQAAEWPTAETVAATVPQVRSKLQWHAQVEIVGSQVGAAAAAAGD